MSDCRRDVEVIVSPKIHNTDTQVQAQLQAQFEAQKQFQAQLQAQLQKIIDVLKSKKR